jgi:hypothetical protein
VKLGEIQDSEQTSDLMTLLYWQANIPKIKSGGDHFLCKSSEIIDRAMEEYRDAFFLHCALYVK